MEVPETIVTVLAVAAFVISLFIAARLTKLDWRTAWILMVVNIVIGLIAFSALTAFPLFSRHAIGALAPAKQVAIAPLILVFELLVGTYLASTESASVWTLHLMNTGSVELIVSAVYVNGKPVTFSGVTSYPRGDEGSLLLNVSTLELDNGSTCLVKVVTSDG